jgi:manganese efflux pump family protein
MLVKIAVFVVPLGIDTFAVAVALGLRGAKPLRPALTFAFFEAVMPLVGLLLGRVAGARFATPAVVLGGVVLIAVALHLAKEALEEGDETETLSFTSLRTAALAGLGISMDELAIGFPMGTSGLPVPATIGAISVQTFLVTYLGIAAGTRLGEAFGRRTSRIAGLVAAAAFAMLGIYLIAQRFVPGLPEV